MPVKAATSMVQFRMDTNLKEQSEEIFKKLGLTMTSAFTIFAQAVVNHRIIPFEISLPEETPNYATKAAMEEFYDAKMVAEPGAEYLAKRFQR